ncbi:hypothetical protein AUP68_06463 [Ilyonectria robusta]
MALSRFNLERLQTSRQIPTPFEAPFSQITSQYETAKMPVTTKPSPFQVGRNRDPVVDAADRNFSRRIFDIITQDCHSPYEDDPRRPGYKPAEGPRSRINWSSPKNHFKGLRMIASSFDGSNAGAEDAASIATYNNGFINGLIRAFNQDLHLIVRPDDVWQAILSQFSLFVNGNAKRLRHLFIEHEGKRTLTVNLTPMDLADIDLAPVAREFVSVIQANVADAELKEWMMPAFSTTTDHDRAVAGFSTMGALQHYFDYHMLIGCGLPSVTLQGERADWAALAARIERLPRYGDECARWAELLHPVMRHFLITFDAPDSPEVHDFWLRVAHEAGMEGSGMGIRTLSGWITAFAYFGENGEVTKDFTEEDIRDSEKRYSERGRFPLRAQDRKRLVLDGVKFPLMRPASIPRSIIILPMKIQDLKAGVRFTTIISGSIGMTMSARAATAQPVSAWWVVEEFVEPIDLQWGLKTENLVTGSTMEGTSKSSSALRETRGDYDEKDIDSDFDVSALP